MAPTGGGASPAGGPGAGDLHRRPRQLGTRTRPAPDARTATRRTWWSSPIPGSSPTPRSPRPPARDNSDATVGVALLLGRPEPGSDPSPASGRPSRVGRCWPTPPTAPETRWPSSPGPGTPRSSSRGRCARPSRAGSPSTTSRHRTHRANPPARHGDLPERAHPPDDHDPHRDLRGAVSGLPAARPLHHQHHRSITAAPPARRDHPRPPPPRPRPAISSHLPPTPAHGRTLHRLADRRRQPAAAVPRNRSSTTCGSTTASPDSTCAGC